VGDPEFRTLLGSADDPLKHIHGLPLSRNWMATSWGYLVAQGRCVKTGSENDAKVTIIRLRAD
jgi:hypothetical protein